MTYNIEKIATLIGARRYGESEATVGWLLTDSRSLCFPEQTLFFALRTAVGDGHRYIADLYRRGVRSFVVEQVPDDRATLYPEANFLRVPSPLAALQRLAERHRDEFSIPVVGITGSNGKTWVKEWLYQLLSLHTPHATLHTPHANLASHPSPLTVTRSPRSYNSQIGVPLSVWLLNERSQVGLFEAGISQPGEMLALRDIIQPTVGVFTHLGSAHQENFRSLEEKCTEKLQLFHDARAIVYPTDDDTVSRCLRRSQFAGERIGWSRANAQAALYVESVERQPSAGAIGAGQTEGLTVTYIYKGTRESYTIPFIDEASVENSITCVATALYLGLTPEQIAERTPLLEPIAMRLEVKEGVRGLTLINDAYNNDLQSLDIALDFMQRRPDQQGRRRTLILSDIFQSGEQPAELYSEVSRLVQKRGIDRFIGIGPEVSAAAGRIDLGQKWCFDSVEQFLASGVFRSLHDEVVLLKGARAFGFERISDLLEQKVHETILEVDLSAVVDNLNHYRSLLKPETRLVCMIKADAYGAGAVEIARTLQDHRVDYLAVAVADEGAVLRRAGITQNIIVMNPEMSSFQTLFDYDLEPEVYSFRLLEALIHAARSQGITGWPVHIKLDTGMHRLGFEAADMERLVDVLQHQQAVMPRSVFSHFVGSDSPDFDDFSTRQYDLFIRLSDELQAAFPHKILRHICNSAAIEHFPERQLDMCRLGIGLYGVDPFGSGQCTVHSAQCTVHSSQLATDGINAQQNCEQRTTENCELRTVNSDPRPTENCELRTVNSDLTPVSTLRTTILQIHDVPAGDTVGYSRRGTVERDSRIAAIPIGYADGLDRRLGNRRGYCIVGGRRAPYVGNICMDVALVDVTGIDCREGDAVEVFGRRLPVAVIAQQLGTIAYEVLTSVSGRVARVYYKD